MKALRGKLIMKRLTKLNLVALSISLSLTASTWAASGVSGGSVITKESETTTMTSKDAIPLSPKSDPVDLTLQQINADAAVAEGLCLDKFPNRDARAVCLARAAEDRLKRLMGVADTEASSTIPTTSSSSHQEFQTELNDINSIGGVSY